MGNNTYSKPNFKELKRLSLRDKKDLAINELGLSTRTVNALDRKGIIFVGKLLQTSYVDILNTRYIGMVIVKEVHSALKKLGLDELWDYGEL